jgi:RNA polymerase sigma-70 factor (ECF subfamily)
MTAPDAESAAWVTALAPGTPGREASLARLHAQLVRVARAEARRRATRSPVEGTELEDVVQQAADDALLVIVRKLDEFRGGSRFTTWAAKFAILEVAAKVTRHAWRRAGAPRPPEDWERLPDRFGFTPPEAAEWRELFGALRAAFASELTEHQKRVFTDIVLREVPVDVLVERMGTSRGAIYKTVFDARRKLRSRLVADGHLEEEEAPRP